MFLNAEHYRLFDQFRYYNVEFLIPAHMTTDDSEEEGLAHSFYSEDSELDPTEDAYFDEYDDEEDDNDSVDGPVKVDSSGHFWNVDSVMFAFQCDYLDYEDFLDSNFWDLLGITKNQLDLIDWSYITSDIFSDFVANLKKYKDHPIEKRIKYAIVASYVWIDTLVLYANKNAGVSSEECLKYVCRLIDKHTPEESSHLLDYLIDYYRFYPDALAMNKRRAEEGGPVFKYDQLPKPSRIKDLHDKAVRDNQTMTAERMSKERKQLNDNIKDVVESFEYRELLFKDKKYSVIAVTCQEDLDREGNVLDHCVASYGVNLADGSSFIYFIRKNSDLDSPFFTAEIIPRINRQSSATLKQCYTAHDSTMKPESLKKFLIDWAAKKRIKIACLI